MFLVAGIAPSKAIAIEGDVSPETVCAQLGRVVARVVTGDDWHPALPTKSVRPYVICFARCASQDLNWANPRSRMPSVVLAEEGYCGGAPSSMVRAGRS